MSEFIQLPQLEYQIAHRLKGQWRELVEAAGGRVAQVDVLSTALAKEYIDRGRSTHHNLFHINDVDEVLDRYRSLAQNFTALKFAGDGHDVVYTPGSPTNEQESAAFMRRIMEELGLPESIIEETGRLIVLTERHLTTADDIDGKLLIDADLSILAASPEKYKRYTQAIKREYVDSGRVPKKVFRQKRAEFLAELLGRDRIFLTDEIHNELGSAAKQNVEQELARLPKI